MEIIEQLDDDMRLYRKYERLSAMELMRRIEAAENALRPFARYFEINDCADRKPDSVLEVPIRDLHAAFKVISAQPRS